MFPTMAAHTGKELPGREARDEPLDGARRLMAGVSSFYRK